MASSFSTNLGIEKPASGELSGTWGDVTNFNFDIFDRITGAADLTASDLTTDLTIRAASPTSGQSNVQTGMFSVINLKDSGSDLGGTNVEFIGQINTPYSNNVKVDGNNLIVSTEDGLHIYLIK